MRLTRTLSSRYPGLFQFAVIAFWVSSIYLTYFYSSNSVAYHPLQAFPNNYNHKNRGAKSFYEYNYHEKKVDYDKELPLIFIGGMPRSGTTLMRAMLDAHPDIRCGQETRVIPRLLGMRANWLKSTKEKTRLEEAGVTREVINSAMKQFILEVIIRHGHAAKFYCNKDPFTLKSLRYLKEIFPNSKFILMLRDGRATAHSIISRHVTISGFDITSYRDVLTKWNRAIEAMYTQCMEVGNQICLPVHYEQLVLQPMAETKRIFEFLEIPYDDAVLHHEQHMTNISLSSVEKSTDQVQRPLYLDALSSWFGKIPEDVLRDLPHIAPMLRRIGYDPYNHKPKYGVPDQLVLNKTKLSNRR